MSLSSSEEFLEEKYAINFLFALFEEIEPFDIFFNRIH